MPKRPSQVHVEKTAATSGNEALYENGYKITPKHNLITEEMLLPMDLI